MNSGIYRLHWGSENNYFYYGQSLDLRRRKRNHETQLAKPIHWNRKLKFVFDKYGKPEFEIVKYCAANELDYWEQKYLDEYFENQFCCNLSPFASSTKGIKRTKEQKLNYSLSKAGDKNPMFGKPAPNKGRKMTREFCERIGISKKGKKYQLGLKRNGIQKKRISDGIKKSWTEQRKLNSSEIHRNRNLSWTRNLALSGSKFKLIDTKSGIIFSSFTEAIYWLNIQNNALHVRDMVSGRRGVKNKTTLMFYKAKGLLEWPG